GLGPRPRRTGAGRADVRLTRQTLQPHACRGRMPRGRQMQYRLTAPSILAAWEHGAGRLPLDRAIAILWAASTCDDVDPADLPLAERDRRLLAIRAATFGPTIPARATCPECNAE